MNGFSLQNKSKKYHLVFAITDHNILGRLIEPYAVLITPKGEFEYGSKKVTKHTFIDFFDNLGQNDIRLIEKIDRYSDENLQKRFNRHNLKTREFYEALTKEFIINIIRPFIDKVIYDVVGIMAEHEVKLYYKGFASERIKEGGYPIQKNIVNTCSYFEKKENCTHYRLVIESAGKILPLQNSGAYVIASKPCILVHSNNVYRFESDWDGKKLLPFLLKEFIEIPAKNEKQFFKKFAEKSIRQYPFVAQGFEVRVIDVYPSVSLKIENHWQGSLVIGLYFTYEKGVTFLPDDKSNAQTIFIELPDNNFYFEKIFRKQDYENQIINSLIRLGLKRIDQIFFTVPKSNDSEQVATNDIYTLQSHILIDWLTENRKEIEGLGIQINAMYSEKVFYTGILSLKIEILENTDWFDIRGNVTAGSFEIPFINLKSNILSGNREFVLPDGTVALIPIEWMNRYYNLSKYTIDGNKRLRLKKFHFTFLQEANLLKENFLSIDSESITTLQYALPRQLNANLRPYQQIGYKWMMRLKDKGFGGCLADDMGIGKTIQTIALLSQVHLADDPPKNSNTVEPNSHPADPQLSLFSDTNLSGQNHKRNGNCSLIILPMSLIHNWMLELKRFSPELKVLIHTGINRAENTSQFKNFDLILTTYGTVRNDIELLTAYHYRCIILDESQVIKNASSKIFSAIKRLKADWRLVLTGTPLENSLIELWSQFSFLNPGMLGSLSNFKKEYVLPIEKRNDTTQAEKLKLLISPLILRRTKDQVAPELPTLTEKIYYCDMTLEQERFYESKKSEIRNAILQSIDTIGADRSRFLILRGLMRLRLIANHPQLMDRGYTNSSGKFIEVTRSIQQLVSEGHKTLIFSQFVKHLDLFTAYCQENNLPHSTLIGSMTAKDREKAVAEFQADIRARLFLISLKAGGVGLNLTNADYVFMLDPWWNPAVEEQAINRAHRIGQDKKVFVYKFITRRSVEEKILTLQQKKSNLVRLIISPNITLKTNDIEELKSLLI